MTNVPIVNHIFSPLLCQTGDLCFLETWTDMKTDFCPNYYHIFLLFISKAARNWTGPKGFVVFCVRCRPGWILAANPNILDLTRRAELNLHSGVQLLQNFTSDDSSSPQQQVWFWFGQRQISWSWSLSRLWLRPRCSRANRCSPRDQQHQ